MQLFADRAQAVQPDFRVTVRNGEAIAELCRQLDGLPLALELAAARVSMLSPAQMLARLSRRFDLLVSRKRDVIGRHQTLRAAIEWGCELLSPALQQFFARLSVFHGGWTLSAAAALSEEPGTLEYLEQLTGCSLVLAEADRDPQPSRAPGWISADDGGVDEVRFRMLPESLREYAREKRTGSSGSETERRHAQYFLALAEVAECADADPAGGGRIARLVAEQDNLRAALAWAEQSRETEIGLRLATAMDGGYWRLQGDMAEGRHLPLSTFLAPASPSIDPPTHVKALRAAARLAHRQSDFAAAEVYVEAALATCR